MPGPGSSTVDAAPHAAYPRGRAQARGSDRRAGSRLRPLRLPPDHGAAAPGGLASECEAGGTDLEAGGAQSAEEATEARSPLVRRWFVHPSAGRASGSRLVLRLRLRAHARRQAAADADAGGRVHARMPGHRCRAPARLGGRARAAGGAVRRTGNAGVHSFGQRRGVHGEGRARVASPGQRQDVVHRTRQPLGERLHRIVQRQTAR